MVGVHGCSVCAPRAYELTTEGSARLLPNPCLVSSGAAAVGAIMIPAMLRYGYPPAYAAATAATGGTLGVLIPPSNPMILYGIGNIRDLFGHKTSLKVIVDNALCRMGM